MAAKRVWMIEDDGQWIQICGKNVTLTRDRYAALHFADSDSAEAVRDYIAARDTLTPESSKRLAVRRMLLDIDTD